MPITFKILLPVPCPNTQLEIPSYPTRDPHVPDSGDAQVVFLGQMYHYLRFREDHV